MKKVLIILLSTLIVFSFTSCDNNNSGSNDKTATATTDTKGFLESYRAIDIAHNTFEVLAQFSSSEPSEIAVDLASCTKLTGDYVAELYRDIYPSENKITVKTVEGSGKITGSYIPNREENVQKISATYNDVVIAFTYTVNSDSSAAEKTGKIKMSGSIEIELNHTTNELSYASTSLSINGTSYPDITSKGVLTVIKDKQEVYVTDFSIATVNGVDVDLDVLNKEKVELI